MRYVSKKFLSDNIGEGGSMICEVESPRPEDLTEYTMEHPSVDASVILRACYGEPVALDFTIRSEKGLIDRVKKINTMIEEMCKFRESLAGAWLLLKDDIAVKQEEENKEGW